MNLLNLHAASRTMSGDVGFLLAIPILQPDKARSFIRPTPVAGIIYIDSEAPGFFIADDELRCLVAMTQEFIGSLAGISAGAFDRIRNPLSNLGTKIPQAERLPSKVGHALELVSDVDPPKAADAFQLNFDYSDFIPI